MHDYISDWEVRRFRDQKIRNAIAEAERDRLAERACPAERARFAWPLVTVLIGGILAIAVWLIRA
jgi:hypothetical protein